MKIQLKFIITTILSAVSMLGLSTVFHAVLLHDFQGLLFSFNQLVIGLSIVYVGIALVLLFFINRFWDYFSLPKAIVFSSIIGLVFYIFASLMGHTFNDSHTTTQLFIDVVWQLIEQGIGGCIIYNLLAVGYSTIN